MRELIDHVPTWIIAVAMVGGAVVLSAAGVRAVRSRGRELLSGESSDVAAALLGIVGAVYGIILAFVIVTLWDDFQHAQAVVAQEATDLAELARDARGLGSQAERRVDDAIASYIETVVDDEWPRMREGHQVEDAWRRLDDLSSALQSIRTSDERELAWYHETISSFNDVVSSRRERIAIVHKGLPVLLLIFLFAGGIVLAVFLVPFALVGTRFHGPLIVSATALLAFVLLLVVLFSYPFSGDLSVSPEPFRSGVLSDLIR